MNSKPMLMSGESVRRIFNEQKTETRRFVRRNYAGRVQLGGKQWHIDDPNAILACPYGEPGDLVWVRETFQPLVIDGATGPSGEVDWTMADYATGKGYEIHYPATEDIIEYLDMNDELSRACKPSIHMPRWASRLTLRISSVTVEKLHDITDEGILAEGVRMMTDAEGHLLVPISSKHCPTDYKETETMIRALMAALWDNLNDQRAPWKSNPPVYVIKWDRMWHKNVDDVIAEGKA